MHRLANSDLIWIEHDGRNKARDVVTRRHVLQRVGAVAMAVTFAPHALGRTRAPGPQPARDVCDHLVLGAADLDRAIAWVEEATGVRAVPGGSHPGAGTRNALLSLGGRQYLEILAPDPAQPKLTPHYAFLRDLGTARLVGWAAQMQDGSALAERLRAAGLDSSGPTPGSRQRPDGTLMKWTTLSVKTDYATLVPFFIAWDAGLLHPAADSPAGCRLRALEFVHPEPQPVSESLLLLGINAQVERGTAAGIRALLNTPRGSVTL